MNGDDAWGLLSEHATEADWSPEEFGSILGVYLRRAMPQLGPDFVDRLDRAYVSAWDLPEPARLSAVAGMTVYLCRLIDSTPAPPGYTFAAYLGGLAAQSALLRDQPQPAAPAAAATPAPSAEVEFVHLGVPPKLWAEVSHYLGLDGPVRGAPFGHVLCAFEASLAQGAVARFEVVNLPTRPAAHVRVVVGGGAMSPAACDLSRPVVVRYGGKDYWITLSPVT